MANSRGPGRFFGGTPLHAAKARVAAAICCGAVSLSAGAAAPLAGLLACRDLADSAARLACFDRESAALAAATTVAGAPAAAVRPAPSVLDAQQQFGLRESQVAEREVAAGARAGAVARIEAQIASLTATGDGRLLFTLDNGQVWRQLSREGDMLARAGDRVTITRGVFSSYWLELPSQRGCKVTRLR